ncbi:MAG: hypothetical protein PHI44_04445 [Candidatus Ratteibacteria bacterium]|nr:hypothetical protein [Candidatus Ratteibacteria bacterium]
MIRKTGIIFLLITMFFSGCAKKGSDIVLPISEQKIEEAIEYGIKNVELSTPEFVSDWTVDLGYGEGKGSATLITPFLKTALLSRQAKLIGQEINRALIKKALKEDADCLTFEVLLFGGYPQFGRSVKFVLQYNQKELLPVYTFLPQYSEMGRDYIQTVKAIVKFKKTDIPVDAKVILKTQYNIYAEGTEKYTCEFEFDLSKYR